MKPIYEAWFCHIEVTNFCWKDCVYCSRFSRHIRKDQRVHMSLDEIEQALKSLADWPSGIGIIGGEPTIHPQFKEMCTLLLDYFPASKYGLWSTGGKRYDENLGIIKETFKRLIAYNEHNETQQSVCRHQPATLAINDLVKDEELKKQLIDNCWVQKNWCPSIGHKGAFFCEVAYAIDTILDGAGGYSVVPGWWKKEPKDFKDQVDRYCGFCGMSVPFTRQLLKDKKELISIGNYHLYKSLNLPCMSDNDVEIFDETLEKNDIQKFSAGWDPQNYRGDVISDGVHQYK